MSSFAASSITAKKTGTRTVRSRVGRSGRRTRASSSGSAPWVKKKKSGIQAGRRGFEEAGGRGGHSRWCQHQAQIWYPHLHGRKCLSVASNGLQQSGQSSPVSLSSSSADIVSLCVLSLTEQKKLLARPRRGVVSSRDSPFRVAPLLSRGFSHPRKRCAARAARSPPRPPKLTKD